MSISLIHALFSSVTAAGYQSQPVVPSLATFQPDPADEHRSANEATVIAHYEVPAPPPRLDAEVASPRSAQELPLPIASQATATEGTDINSGKRHFWCSSLTNASTALSCSIRPRTLPSDLSHRLHFKISVF